MDLTNSSALVTGGAGGFGSATVRRLAEAGASVVIADLAEEAGTALADELGPAVTFVRTDVTDDGSVENAVAQAAGIAPLRAAVIVHGGPAAGTRIISREGKAYPASTFARTLEIYLTGTYRVLSKVAEQMATNEALESGQRGVIITTASIAGFEGQTGQSDYSAAKGGVIGMNLTAARDLSPLGVRVMSIAPGVMLTPPYGPDATEESLQERFKMPNPRRAGRPDEYARLARHIVDNDFLNGDVIRLDGALRF